MLPVISKANIYGQDVLLVSEGLKDSLARCIALACSTEYHMTDSYEKSSDPLSLAVAYDKMLLVYSKEDDTLRAYNNEGAGCIVLVYDGAEYKLATRLDNDWQHITTFSQYDPLIASLLEQAI
ncbi:Hypothetical protein POVR2_LOCUS5 [uncultured virus]|nr:Hypothetical protein POVR2_LOCUS5 [uncultured virus]